jgi:hypothetical protein
MAVKQNIILARIKSRMFRIQAYDITWVDKRNHLLGVIVLLPGRTIVLHHNNRDNTESSDEAGHETTATRIAQRTQHFGKPKWTNLRKI